ncbi:ABC transporter permease [Mucilaginibacter ginkgonis]|uniref:ABC transporter permease n=1 Tax=Mucilaginibacter ginkgonis TaxID=2682091 RepID=A0A6I4HYU3_9SPHI|nr:ABC transporter permease [Mucilaginibacter ginkgonis]QQL50368.1 ABC transporter permease [Mucilaginibacter ginkgonis]
MIKNYLKIAWRSILKNKLHATINIVGLAVGMAVTILISLWVWDEVSFNKSFKNYDRFVQVMQHQTFNGEVGTQTAMPIPLGYLLKQDYKSDFKHVVLSSWSGDHILTYGDKKVIEIGNFMQPEAPDLLKLDMVSGTRNSFNDQSTVLISQSAAKAVFGNTDPLNKTVKLDNNFILTVGGVYKDFASNSTFDEVNFIAPWAAYLKSEKWIEGAQTRWGNNSFQIFAELNPNADLDKVSAKIKNIKAVNILAQGDKIGASFKPVVFLQPMSKFHLYSQFKNGVNTGGAIQFVWMFSLIGLFVLMLACINFMNLSTAQSEKRAKEVGIRKTLGSFKKQLISQFYTESVLVAFMAFIISIVMVVLALSWFNNVANKHIAMPWANIYFWMAGIVFSMLTGLIAGSYPAFYLSSFVPVKVLKGTFRVGRLAALPRKILVVLQFTISVALIIGTVVIFRQVQHTKDRPVGYERTGVISVDMQTMTIHRNFLAVRNKLLNSGTIVEMAESGSPLTDVYSNNSGFDWRGKAPGLQDDFATITITPEYGKTAGWNLIAGRNLSRDLATDSNALILNEAAVKFMNFKHPVGELVTNGTAKLTVVGVVKDMVMSSPYEPVKPTIYALLRRDRGSVVVARLNPKISAHKAVAKIEQTFKAFDPDSPFTYQFTDDNYNKKFAYEERIGKLAGFFTLFAIFISCMGLFGMASFMAEQRVKEIGVRKVLGATVLNLWKLMSTDFVMLVCISFIIAMPLAYYFMHGWLQNYTYRSELSWWIFALTGIGTLVITLLTISYQSIKAALTNPVKSLRSE